VHGRVKVNALSEGAYSGCGRQPSDLCRKVTRGIVNQSQACVHRMEHAAGLLGLLAREDNDEERRRLGGDRDI
jgi:hypothetical protein